ncbi:MAG: sulfurtransferase TusA family protein [Phycisphaerae bacterium]|nr:sulfurtransferase TusA family protein [Phycisphaerae bacterium]
MSVSASKPILRIPDSVRRDVLAYRAHVEKFLTGETSAVAFRAYRVPMGIYEQRTSGHYMVRVRIGAGLATGGQLRKIAQMSTRFGNGVLHVTTRQNIQIHDVKIEQTPDVLEQLLEAGLSARGGGGNTVRNVSACPGSGFCPNERFEVAPYAIACAEHLLDDSASFNLPRKFKIAFSGCPSDCALASVADVGFFAVERDGCKGFAVYAGGGLGPNAAVGVKIEDFINGDEVFTVAEAVKHIFDAHGDRANRHKARLRYVLKRLGEKEFVELYRRQKQRLIEGGLASIASVRDIFEPFHRVLPASHAASVPLPPGVIAEKTPGLYTLPVTLNLGDLAANEMLAVADLAEKYGCGLIRTTQLQNLLISGIGAGDISAAADELRWKVQSLASQNPQIVACTGAATCKLGLCLSRGLATAIADATRDLPAVNGPAATIRISGCPNSCGHHSVAAIGFQGKAKRVNGRLMPCYDVMTGANISMGEASLADRIGTVPAKCIPGMMGQVMAKGSVDFNLLRRLIDEYGDFSVEFPEDYFRDFGSYEPFSLAGRGPGECGAGVMDVIVLDLDEAKSAAAQAARLPAGKDRDDTIYRAVLSAARALLVTFGLEPKKDREIFAEFAAHLIDPGWVVPETKDLLNRAVDYRMGDIDSLDDLLPQVDKLVERIDTLFKSLDAALKFRAEPVAAPAAANSSHSVRRIDLRGVACPLNFVKAKLELEKVAIGDVLEVLLDGGEPINNVPASFASQGQEVLATEPAGDHFRLTIRRSK